MSIYIASLYPNALGDLKLPIYYNPDVDILKAAITKTVVKTLSGIISKGWLKTYDGWTLEFYTLDNQVQRQYKKYVIEIVHPLGNT